MQQHPSCSRCSSARDRNVWAFGRKSALWRHGLIGNGTGAKAPAVNAANPCALLRQAKR